MASVKSMTGFGRAERNSTIGTFSIEVKSVNHRYLEPKVYTPRELSLLELPLLRIVKDRLARGKVDASVRWTPLAEYIPRGRFNKHLIEQYEVEIAHIAGDLQRQERVPLEVLLNLPGVLERESAEPDEKALMELAGGALEDALRALIEERQREGEVLAAEVSSRLDNLEKMRSSIMQRGPEVLEAYRQRLLKRIEEWSQSTSLQLEPGRLEAEVLLYADRSDVTEELVRLEAHIQAFRLALDKSGGEPQGRAMEFLTQEWTPGDQHNRYKSRDTGIASTVLAMKNEIEKIREQVLNIE